MKKEPVPSKATPKDQELEANAKAPHYDRGIIPAETAARQEREEGEFMNPHPHGTNRKSDADIEEGKKSLDTTEGYTVDNEGLIDNFAIEPEMYINEPGDLREEMEEDRAERVEEMHEVNEEESQGKLTIEHDNRPRGQGII